MMHSYLLINELAKLYNISTQTIRFYEQKGLIMPAKTSEKGYRLYDFNALIRIEEILHLRNIGMSLGEIKLYLEQKSTAHYKTQLEQLETNILDSIKALQNTYTYIQSKKEMRQNFDTFGTQKPFYKDYPARYIFPLKLLKNDFEDLNERAFYQLLSDKLGHRRVQNSQDLIYRTLNGQTTLCLAISASDLTHFSKEELICLPKGHYVCLFHEANTLKTYMKSLTKVSQFLKKDLSKSELTQIDFNFNDFIDFHSTELSIFTNRDELTCFQMHIPDVKS